MNNLAKVHAMQGKYAQAEALQGQALEISRRVLGPEHPDTLNGMYWMATVTTLQGRPGEAEALYRQVLEARRRTLGPEHPDTLTVLAGLASLYQAQGRYPEAETCAAEALAGRRQVLGPDHAETLDVMASLALACQAQGKFRGERAGRASGRRTGSPETAGRLAALPRGEPAGRQSGRAEEVRRSGTAAHRRLPGHGGQETAHGRAGPGSPGPGPRQGRPTL